MEKEIYIFGAGKNGVELFYLLGGAQITAFIDNDEKKQNTYICEIECISVEEAIRRGAQKSRILISVSKCDMIERQLREAGFEIIFNCTKWIRQQKFFKPTVVNEEDYRYAVPFNHYESPYPEISYVRNNEKNLFDIDNEILDIDLNVNVQMSLLEWMKKTELPAWRCKKEESQQFRYYYDNKWYGKGCADVLYYMIRYVEPNTIIEVGSGHSTAVMLDTNEFFMENKINIISIEPNAERLRKLLRAKDNIDVYEKNLQDIPLEFFKQLNENDILFIDSSHVAKIGSDVNYLIFEILPRLNRGVYIHFHDIFYPFIYPKEWVYDGRAYNEMYLLRAFLMNNKEYSIQFFGDMLNKKYGDRIAPEMRGCGVGSLWIKKVL